jgi:hypothetical protein
VVTATCPYCKLNLWQKLPSKSSRYADECQGVADRASGKGADRPRPLHKGETGSNAGGARARSSGKAWR